jgi:hypothetical protein
MNDIRLSPTEDTPEVLFTSSSTTQHVKGRSMPEDAFAFYGPLIDWLSSDAVPSGSVFEFHFEYLNTASTKQVMALLKAIDARTPQLGLRIVWAYDEGDRGMLKTGQLLGKLLQHPMEFSERG